MAGLEHEHMIFSVWQTLSRKFTVHTWVKLASSPTPTSIAVTTLPQTASTSSPPSTTTRKMKKLTKRCKKTCTKSTLVMDPYKTADVTRFGSVHNISP